MRKPNLKLTINLPQRKELISLWCLIVYFEIIQPINPFRPMFYFYTPWESQKIFGFLAFLWEEYKKNIGLKWVNLLQSLDT